MSREDDVITSAGYRIGPSEIEDTLLKHPAVALSAVVGIPDPIRTEAVKAWIVLRPGFKPATRWRAKSRISSKVAARRPRIPAPRRVRGGIADDRDRQGAAKGAAGEGIG